MSSILLASHFYSLSQSNPLNPKSIITFPQIPFCNSTQLLLSATSNRTHRRLVPAKKKNRSPDPVLSPSIVDEVSEADEFEEFDDDEFDDDDEGFDGDDDFQDDFLDEDAEPRFGDGGGGGGISLAGTTWDKEVLAIAEDVSLSFNGELGIYAFKTLQNAEIRVRIERLSNKSGSPTMEDIEAFSNAYRERLDQAEAAGSIPVDVSLEVSSPGLERAVRVPEDLGRFKDRPMYVKYTTRDEDATSSCEHDGVLRLESFDLETKCCTWGLADVKVNREKAGKGRPLSKKQREYRFQVIYIHAIIKARGVYHRPFNSVLLLKHTIQGIEYNCGNLTYNSFLPCICKDLNSLSYLL